jgi:fucose 4-O-acetylase-like acetyltransferase
MPNTHLQTPSKVQPRNDSIDILRGWLIVFVIIGHVVLGSVHDNIIRYSIYAFHMPLFIGLSGYLINPVTLRQSGLFAVLTRYWWRVLLPFLVAFVFYSGILLFHAYQEERLSLSLVLSYLTTPYYHLWFIPTLVIWVIAFWASLKLNIPIVISLMLCAIASVVWASIPKSEQWLFLAPLLSKKVAYFFLFFIFGAYLRSTPNNKLLRLAADFKVLPLAVIAACTFVYLLNIGVDKSPLRAIVWLVMNLLLIVLCTQAVIQKPNKKIKRKKSSITSSSLASIGRNSLPIYLWHAAPLFVLKGFDFHQSHVFWYYLVSTALIIVVCAAILKFEDKNHFLNRVLYGYS